MRKTREKDILTTTHLLPSKASFGGFLSVNEAGLGGAPGPARLGEPGLPIHIQLFGFIRSASNCKEKSTSALYNYSKHIRMSYQG